MANCMLVVASALTPSFRHTQAWNSAPPHIRTFFLPATAPGRYMLQGSRPRATPPCSCGPNPRSWAGACFVRVFGSVRRFSCPRSKVVFRPHPPAITHGGCIVGEYTGSLWTDSKSIRTVYAGNRSRFIIFDMTWLRKRITLRYMRFTLRCLVCSTWLRLLRHLSPPTTQVRHLLFGLNASHKVSKGLSRYTRQPFATESALSEVPTA